MSFSTNEQPWNEEQWEAFFKASDLRAARFGELLETLRDHPDRDEIISQEMGWDKPVEQDEEVRELIDELNQAAAESEWRAAPVDEFEDEDAEADDHSSIDSKFTGHEHDATDLFAEETEEDQELKQIPAYVLATDVGEEVHKALMPYLEEEPSEDDADEYLGEALVHSFIPAAKLARGHGMGYDDEVLCGNIVCCRIALDSATTARQALTSLAKSGRLPADMVATLTGRLGEVEQAIEQRIAWLRSKVWW